VCPTGELARVYVGRLDNDGVIRTEAAFGYSLEVDVMNVVTPLELDRPMPDALRNRRVVVGNKEDILQTYRGYLPLDIRSPWVSTAAVPTLGNIAFVFRLQCAIDSKEFAEVYFRIVGALLSFYNFESARAKNRVFDGVKASRKIENSRIQKGTPLTERQELIIELIQSQKTNSQIAHLLGYSESLIRQETIIIYQKLGVSGRRELIEISSTPSTSSKEFPNSETTL
jgi:DNA-binding CsgD family transcriptional regulator